jgi:hypothetical protein
MDADVRAAEADPREQQQKEASERAVDAVLADSFPASDPPSWTLGVTDASAEPVAAR